MSAIQKQILAFLTERNPEPMKPRALARRIGIRNRARDDFNAAVEVLIGKKQLRRLANGKLCLPGETRAGSRQVRGTVRRTQTGSAWIIPDPAASEFNQPDIFVYPEHLADAQNGDTVLVRLSGRRGGGGRRTGRVEEVLERSTHTFVGTYFEDWNQGFVRIDGASFPIRCLSATPERRACSPATRL